MVSSGKLKALLNVLAAALVVGCNTNPPKPETAPVVAAPKTPATARAQRLATALRENLRRRKAAGREARPATPRN